VTFDERPATEGWSEQDTHIVVVIKKAAPIGKVGGSTTLPPHHP